MPPRWRFDHVVALLELGCAVFVVVYMVDLGLDAEAAGTEGRTLLDRAFPFLLGLGAGAVLVRWAVRSWRAGNRAAAEPVTPPTEYLPPLPLPPEPDAQPRSAYLPPDPLSPEGERELARVVAVLADAGVFTHAPDPAQLHWPVADHGEPFTADVVLAALDEAAYYEPGFDPAAYSANLAFHDSHGEQFADVLREQIDDLVRLAGGGLDGVTVTVELTERAGTARVPTRIRLGDEVLAYDGASKYLSSVVHVALARTLRERRTGRRLAWLWSDQGVWLSGLPDGTVERLNAVLGPAAGEGWEWVDEQEPVAAGEMYPA